jgi:hypothetical protein
VAHQGAHFNQFTLPLQGGSESSLSLSRWIQFPVSEKLGSDLRISLIFLNPLKHSCNYMHRVTRNLLPKQTLFSSIVSDVRVRFGKTYNFLGFFLISRNASRLMRLPCCLSRSRVNVVGIATAYRLDDRGVGVRVPVGSRIFSLPRRPDRL